MTMKEMSRMSREDLMQAKRYAVASGNLNAAVRMDEVLKFYGNTVKVVKGRKVPIGTTGECFWMGSTCHSPYGDPWGIYSYVRIGIKDEDENIYWTNLDNVELVK